MLQPKSKLPWQINYDNYKRTDEDKCFYSLASGNSVFDNILCGNIESTISYFDTEDIDYLIQACNNFPEAINLLKIAKEALEELGEFQDGWNEDLDKIEKFLEKIYKDGK